MATAAASRKQSAHTRTAHACRRKGATSAAHSADTQAGAAANWCCFTNTTLPATDVSMNACAMPAEVSRCTPWPAHVGCDLCLLCALCSCYPEVWCFYCATASGSTGQRLQPSSACSPSASVFTCIGFAPCCLMCPYAGA